ncbi:Flp family type IVb pilin [Aurantiacibacter luteus]|uniref:Pilus assembly protein n=1 Tax=Aurantiacibacter luteus TaxID=1581420 RepID=A0A0G9MYC8_9SPHN|nr:Flp family type IVb pilin [Aurantiacibacter luteus]KLE35731.1 hypothetical protein AAW00_04900 [Aurantiacibacter luteus]
MKSIAIRIAADQRGATSIEYGLLAMQIGIALLGTMMTMGNSVESHYETVGTQYHDAANVPRN